MEPYLPEVLRSLETCPMPVVAAIHGTALGGSLETALASHYRCAVPSGFPEVTLGLLPGAGGTQRLPRLMGVRAALDLIVSGKPISAVAAHRSGLIDELIEGDLLADAIAYAERLVADVLNDDASLALATQELNLGDEFVATQWVLPRRLMIRVGFEF